MNTNEVRAPFTDEQIEWLQNNLSLTITKDSDYYGHSYIVYSLKLDGVEISSGYE